MTKTGSLSMYKGTLGNVQIRMWDAIPDCDVSCLNYETCPDAGSKKRCEIRRKYVDSVFKDISPSFKKDSLSAHKAGLLLMPLYNQLITFKLAAHASQHNVYAKSKINPIFKEIRETIKLINQLLDELGIDPDTGRGIKGQKKGGLVDGDSNYYDSLIEDGGTPA